MLHWNDFLDPPLLVALLPQCSCRGGMDVVMKQMLENLVSYS
jgi:hypothetical protein